MTFDPETTPLVVLRLDDGDMEFMTMSEACRFVRDHGSCEGEAMSMTGYALGGASVMQTFRLGSKSCMIRTCWSDSDIRRFEREGANIGEFLNFTSYIVMGENATTPPDIKQVFGRELGRRTSLDATAIDHMSGYDVDWFADTGLCMRCIEFQLWDEFEDLYKDDEAGWNLLADWLQAAWDAQREGIRRAVVDVQNLMTDTEGRRGGAGAVVLRPLLTVPSNLLPLFL